MKKEIVKPGAEKVRIAKEPTPEQMRQDYWDTHPAARVGGQGRSKFRRSWKKNG